MLKTLILSLIEDAIRGLSGPLGVRLRRMYYKRRFASCGHRLVIEPGSYLIAPEWISVGDDVWIDRQVSLIAGPPHSGADVIVHENPQATTTPGEIKIARGAHIGIGTIIQGHGGVEIGAFFTSSPHVKIYSFSNDYRRCRSGTVRSDGARPVYRQTPVSIGDNVWIGLNAVVIGHTIGGDTFVKPGSVVSTDVPANSIVAGNPAARSGPRFSDEPNDADALHDESVAT